MVTKEEKAKSIDFIRELDIDDQDAMVRKSGELKKSLDSINKTYKSSFPTDGKLICVVQERLERLKAQRLIASNTSMADYWKTLGGEKLNPHAMSCAVAFGTYVQTEIISESDYDLCPSSLLETAASISTAVGGDVQHAAVASAAFQLKERGKDAARNLKAILETVKPREPMKPEKAQQLIADLLADGYGPMFVHTLELELPEIKDENKLRAYYSGLIGCIDNCGDEEMQEKWTESTPSGPKLIAA